jgi:hypothetical protein
MAILALLANVSAGLGLGAMALRVLGIDQDLSRGEHWTLSFAIGFGLLGWLVFPIGVAGGLTAGPLWALLLAGTLGIGLLWTGGLPTIGENPDAVGKALFAIAAAVLFLDLAEAMAPPADADSLAYHFNWPKRFIDVGAISFIPQAWTGAVPMLVQMTYIPPLALGGETALTLWTMIASWAAAAMLFVLCRRHVSLNWSLAVVLIYLTTPAVVFGGGSGQVEPKIALFVMAGAWGAARAVETGRMSFAMLAGLAAGFFAGAKYMGLLFVATAGLVVLFQKGGFRRSIPVGAAFAVAAIASGFQWYAWNAVHTGDPVFPMFFEWLGRSDLGFWSVDYNVWFKNILRLIERDVPRSLWWFIGYPFRATFDPLLVFEARRIGLGPYGVLVLPFVIFGAWSLRDRIRKSRLLPYAVVCGLYYALWFFTGSSQRIRHLVPVLPLFLVVITVAAVRFADLKKIRPPLFAALGLTLLVQLAGHGVFSLAYLKHLAGNDDREAFLSRNVLVYDVVPWINTNLGPEDRLFLSNRQILYYLKVPYFYGSPNVQARVELRAGRVRAEPLYRQLKSVGVTHILYLYADETVSDPGQPPWRAMRETGCLVTQKKFRLRAFKSRTLPGLGSAPVLVKIFRLNERNCPQ